MNKANEAYKLLKFISKDISLLSKLGNKACIQENNSGIFYTVDLLTIDNKEFYERSDRSIVIDFKLKKVTWRAYYESGHNGSSFGGVSGEVDWDIFINKAHIDLTLLAKRIMEIKLDKEQQERLEKAKDRTIMKRLVNELKGIDKLI